jgi:transposase
LNFFEHECYLHCDLPRLVDINGKVHQVEVPWARPNSGFTLMLEAYSMLLIEMEMPVNKAGKLLGEYPNRIWTIFNYWMGVSYSEADHSNIKKIGIDETNSKKGHDYITIAIDIDNSRVVHPTEGKGAETITKIADYLETKGTKRENVEQICIDLSPSFISGINKEFPNGAVIFDRFHVKALLNKAMDKVRKGELSSHHYLKGMKYSFLKTTKK